MRTVVIAVISLLVALPAAAAQGAKSPRSGLDTQQIEQLTGAKGQLAEKEGVFKVSVPRTDLQVTAAGVKITPALGLTSWAAFAGSDDNAIVDGDFAMLESELQPVLKALRKAGINIVAIHPHVTGEQPRVLFLHYWGIGATQDLARGLRSALDRTATRLSAR